MTTRLNVNVDVNAATDANDWSSSVRWRQEDPLAGLLRRIRHQDQDAFDQLHAATSRYLSSVAARRLGDETLAEEALQEAYLSVWMNAHQFDPALASGITWLLNIVRNKAVDIARHRGRHPVAVDWETDEARSLPDFSVDVEKEVIRARLTSRLADCLHEQQPTQRQILALAYVRDMPQTAIAQALAMPLGSVKGQVRRAQHQLRVCLEERTPRDGEASTHRPLPEPSCAH
jgi:RNA polymerase sigma-70 factor, ECF subfamily